MTRVRRETRKVGTDVTKPSRSDARWAAAYHEAGHAVFHHRWSYVVGDRGIELSNDGTGYASFDSELGGFLVGLELRHAPAYREAGGPLWAYWEARAEAHIECTMAGPLAEQRFLARRAPLGMALWCGGKGD